MAINLIDHTMPVIAEPRINFANMIKTTGLFDAMNNVCEAYWVYYNQYNRNEKTNRCIQKKRDTFKQLKRAGFIERFNIERRIDITVGELSEESVEILFYLLCKYEGIDAAEEMMIEWLNENDLQIDD